ncbi:HD domain-containing protein 2-like [Asparagus officinalis]|uniref:HD domain-containing protein 2-like n=1 Tax=Asparagus officinalis TaxID=4686 RepID=UPI00098E3495|nr:HD domain-containing protein 2-like [Asparagus officinalis]
MDIIHDIPKEVVSDIAHIDVVPMEEKDKIESEAIDDMCKLLSGGSKTKEMECEENSSFEIKSINSFDKIEMKLQAQEYEKQQGKYFEKFFKSVVDPHAVSHINMVWERFIQKFNSEKP